MNAMMAEFFTGHVKKLQAEGVFWEFEPLTDESWLRALDMPVGQRRPRPLWAQTGSSFESLTTAPCIHFLGDRGYARTRAYLGPPESLQRDQLRLKSESIRAAIASYIPGDLFVRYLRYFMYHYAEYPDALDEALGNILEQFNLCRPGKSAPPSMINYWLQVRPRRPALARTALALSALRWQAPHYIDMVVAMVLYQAAIIGYLQDLKHATGMVLSRQEQTIACIVLDRSFEAFRAFVIFSTLLQLAVFERHNIASGEPEVLLRQQAITGAWQTLFDAGLLATDFGPRLRMICPASHHLRFVKDARLVEYLYRHVVAQREEPMMVNLLGDTERVVHEALKWRKYYYKYFLNGGSKREIMARLRWAWR